MADIPRVNISTDAEITWIRLQQLSGDPDNANAADHFNFGINGTTLTWVDELGNVYTAAAGGSGVTSFNARTGAVVPAEADYTLTLLEDVTSAAQTANFILAAGDGSSDGAYRGRALVAADIPSLPASKITAGTFTAGAYIFEHATATGVPLTLRSTDNSATNPLLRGLDSSSALRWSLDYEGNLVLGRTSGGASFNGNVIFIMADGGATMRFRSGTTNKGQIANDANAGTFALDAVSLDVRPLAGSSIARFSTSTAVLEVGALVAAGAYTNTTINASLNPATTNAVANNFTSYIGSSGTPAAGHGSGFRFAAESATTTNRDQGRLRFAWTVATDASRTARGTLSASDSAGERDCIMWEASGSAAMVGFFGTAPIVKPTVTGSRGGNAALADLLTELAALGLIIDSSSA